MTAPRLAVQIVTWNSADSIDECLDSVAAQTSPPAEVVVVDNASEDGSADRVAAWFSRRLTGTLLRESVNRGFSGGQNRALALTRSDWVLFLNPDAVLPSDFIAQTMSRIAGLSADVGSVAPRILRPDGRIDSTGLVLDRFRRAYDRGRGELVTARYATEEDVLGCTGAVALHRRAMLDDVALDGKPLDEVLFAYYEDLDLSWRARLRGWRCRYIPSLVAVHRRAGRNALRSLPGCSSSVKEQALTVRNRLLVLVKCERLGDCATALPGMILFELARVAYLALRAPGALRGYAQALAALPAALRDRRRILSTAAPGSPRAPAR
ncbi:MAG TPA: glycosyltransferase family 2 protein [Thermoanaerobaculia bacterium]|nr:glycosyltransferase family 2 protein [Thermoanaerobaculia bacterium]